MELRLLVYVLLALIYVGYPLYYLMARPAAGKHRILGLGLMIHGLLAVFWPLNPRPVLIVAGAMMLTLGFGVYFAVLKSHLLWLTAIAYRLSVLTWPDLQVPLVTVSAALILLIAFERCTTHLRLQNGKD